MSKMITYLLWSMLVAGIAGTIGYNIKMNEPSPVTRPLPEKSFQPMTATAGASCAH